MLLLLTLACGPLPDSKPTSDAVDDTGSVDTAGDTAIGPSCVEEPEPPDTKDTGGESHPAATLSGTVTWTLSFDADAEAAGFTDCTYTREYATLTEIGDQGYLCPECSILTTGTAVMTAGYEDCYLQISDNDAESVEYAGLGEVDGEMHFFRSGAENIVLGDLSPVEGDTPFTVTWESESDLVDGGVMALHADGEFTLGTSEDTVVEDVSGARTEPYTCGWPLNSPGGPNTTWDVVDGGVFPNIRLDDQCGEPVDLWDFRGYYLVIDSSAPNCGPCQSMAEGAEAFKARMAAECAPVELITLLNESLGAVNYPASLEVQLEWQEEFGLTSPVLADRGAGYALFPEYLGVEDGMSYPGIILVDPDGLVMYGSTGFSDWTEIEDVILFDWVARGN